MKRRRSRRGDREREEGRGRKALAQSREAITKLQKLTIKPDRHTGATIKLAGTAGQSAHIFGVYDQSCGRARRERRVFRAQFPSGCARGWILPRKENCTAILRRAIRNAAVKRLASSLPFAFSSFPSLPLPPPPPFPPSFLPTACHSPFALLQVLYESVSRNDGGNSH